ncbi:TPA: hypothetical protein ACSP3W_002582 [Aeromonas veronii]|uniref:hypothetical protein n=1 Tax=Aeromonas veronii TaxID=654 RepID=UPI0038D29256
MKKAYAIAVLLLSNNIFAEGIYLDMPPEGLEELSEKGMYIRAYQDKNHPLVVQGLYELYKPREDLTEEEWMVHPYFGCEDMIVDEVTVTDVVSGVNKHTVQEFHFKRSDGTSSGFTVEQWNDAMNQVEKNSMSSLIYLGAPLRIYYQLCGNGAIETPRAIEAL